MTGKGFATTRRIGLASAEVSVTIAGPEAAPLVMLGHALGTDHRMWRPQMAALAGSFRVVAPDFRGHGGSRQASGPCSFRALAADCAGIASALGRTRFSYVGLSLGGVVGMELALGRPDLVDRLVLSNTRCRVDAGFAAACGRRVADAREQGMAALVGPTIERWLPPGFVKARPDLASLFREMFEATEPDAYVALCEELGRLEVWRRLPAITCPTLVIGGVEDHTTPPDVVRDIADRIPGAEAMIFDGAAHFPNVEAPERFSTAVLDFLGRPPASGSLDSASRNREG